MVKHKEANALIVGGGGHSCVLYDALMSIGCFDVIGFVAPGPDGPFAELGVPWLGEEAPLLANPRSVLGDEPVAVFTGIGDNMVRSNVQSAYQRADFAFHFPALVHQRAFVAVDAKLGHGCFIAAGAVIGASARVADGALVNVNAVVDHHCSVDAFASLAQGAAMGGGAHLGPRAVLGIGASLRHGKRIGADTVIHGGAWVADDIDDGKTAGGVPACVTGDRKPGDPYL